jgi:hypothetical protein
VGPRSPAIDPGALFFGPQNYAAAVGSDRIEPNGRGHTRRYERGQRGGDPDQMNRYVDRLIIGYRSDALVASPDPGRSLSIEHLFCISA